MEMFAVALFAAVVAAALVWLFARGKQAELGALLRTREEALAKADAELANLRQDRDQLKTQVAKLETALASERSALEEAKTKLIDTFKALSADALSASNSRFLELARESFGKLHQQSADELAKRQQAVDTLVKPLRESLEKVDGKIAELEKSRATAYGALTKQLESLATAQVTLQTETAKLSTALRSTTTAGTWGELQLRRVVELAGMLEHCDFDQRASVTTNDGRLRPDLVVRLPGGQSIVVDAKAPNEAFRDAASAPDETTRQLKLAEHALKVRGHVDTLGAKAYWEQFQPSPEFVVLFLPGDQFLAAALQSDPSLMERAISRKVLLATPATLIALLKAAAYGWRQEALSKNTEEISALGRQLYDRVVTFAENFDTIGPGLASALKTSNAAPVSYHAPPLPPP